MNQSTEIEPISVKPHRAGNGTQKLYRFDNGYGASVVQFSVGGYGGSYGYELGLWELGVIRWDGESFKLTYDTEITEDVVGHLNEAEVQDYLRRIRDLPDPS